jgi:hypothetical protein
MTEGTHITKISSVSAGLLIILFLFACNRKQGTDPLFTLLPASVTHAGFVNYLDYDRQLKSKFYLTYRNFYNGGGLRYQQ